jgi:hypothetical protein
MVFFPAEFGSFFEQQDRRTLRTGGRKLCTCGRSIRWAHLLTFGYSYAHSTYQGRISNQPVRVLRERRSAA